MTLQRGIQRITTGQGDNPASTVAPSSEVLAAQALLQQRRRAAGILTSPQGATEPAARLDSSPSRAAGEGDNDASNRFDQWAAHELDRRARARAKLERDVEAQRAAQKDFWTKLAAIRLADDRAAPPDPQPVVTAPAGPPPDLQREAEELRLTRLKETNPRRYYLETLPELPDHVRTYAPLLAGAQRRRMVPHMRVYLLARALDPARSGVVDLDRFRLYFTNTDSPYRIFSPRRLRQVLAQGEGVLWDRHTGDRLWLKSPAKVAAALGVDRLTGLPVALPVWPLIEGKHETAAAFYSAFHASRGEGANPISQSTLRQATGAAESTQRTYIKTAELTARRNLAIVGDATKDGFQNAAWEFGRVFKFRDHVGKVDQRRPGWVYVAAHMPSSYASPVEALPRGRQRKINKSLSNLVTYGAQGKRDSVVRVYHDDGAKAGDAYNRDTKHNHYWRLTPALQVTSARPPKLAPVTVWGVFSAGLVNS